METIILRISFIAGFPQIFINPKYLTCKHFWHIVGLHYNSTNAKNTNFSGDTKNLITCGLSLLGVVECSDVLKESINYLEL